jgi:hypothetical protein
MAEIQRATNTHVEILRHIGETLTNFAALHSENSDQINAKELKRLSQLPVTLGTSLKRLRDAIESDITRKGTIQIDAAGVEYTADRYESEKQIVVAEAAMARYDNYLRIGGIALFLIVGVVMYSHFEGWTPLDAIYFSLVTLTTIGFGDLVPHTAIGKTLTCFFLVIGVYGIGGIVQQTLAYIVNSRKHLSAEALKRAFGVDEGDQNVTGELAKQLTKTNFLCFCLFYGCGGILSSIVGWNYSETLYFCIAVISTVGYGDGTFRNGHKKSTQLM